MWLKEPLNNQYKKENYMPVIAILTPILMTLWRWRGVAILAKQVSNEIVASKAKTEIEQEYRNLLIEMAINIFTLLLISLVFPYFLELSIVKLFLASYYIASVAWGMFHAIPFIKCLVQSNFILDKTFDCLIEKKTGYWTNLFYGNTIKKAIIPMIIYMVFASILYVVLFRFLALPYFVEEATDMGIFEIIFSSVYLPIAELIRYIF